MKFINHLQKKSEKEAYSYIIRLTLPIVIQNIFNAAVSSADVLMLNSVSQEAISAVSLATQYSNLLLIFFNGLGSGIAMLSSQYWGKKDIRTIEQVEGIALRFSLLAVFLLTLPSLFAPEFMMRLYTNDEALIQLGSSYLKIVAVSYLFWGLSETYFYTLRSIERVKISTMVNLFTLFLNIGLNALFIYGFFGLPRLGAAGVAIGTTVSRAVQFLICLMISRSSKDVKLRFSALFEKNTLLFQDFLKLSIPAMANTMVWGIAFSLYTAIMGHISSDVVAANSVVSVVRSFGTVFCYAVSSSAGIYIGKYIGANRMQEAKEYSKRALVLMTLTGLIGSGIILLITPYALQIADLSETAMKYLKTMLYINSVYIWGTTVNGTMINGIFRAGGDSKFGLYCDIIDMWVYAIPLGFLSAFIFRFPPMLVYALLCTDEFVKIPWVVRHYKSEKWMKNITRNFN